MGNQTVGELGEDTVLAAIIPLLPAARGVQIGPGDDAAGLTCQGMMLLSTDTMVANRDFSPEWSTARDLGRKAVASNFADIAAMGAEPLGLLVALTVPPQTTLDWLRDFAEGLAYGINQLAPAAGVVGGDLALGDQLHIAITSIGSLAEGEAVKRSGAQAGHLVAIAGKQGQSAAGLDMLRSGAHLSLGSQPGSLALRVAIAAHLSPEPPILLGDSARRSGATAMIDVSDGLVRDAARIAKASAVTLDLDSRALSYFADPLLELALLLDPAPVAAAERAKNWVLQGGEDHCLLACFPPAAGIPEGFRVIGVVTNGKPGAVLVDGHEIAAAGWDSLSSD